MKITIYELLGLIKDDKAPKKIKITGNTYKFDEDYNFYITQGTYEENIRIVLGGKHGEINLLANAFNEIVEIIEEDKDIKELPMILGSDNVDEIARNRYKINELIKEVNRLKAKQ